MKSRLLAAAVVLLAAGPASCARTPSAPTAADVARFLERANDTMRRLGIAGQQAGWVAQNFITADTEALDARATQEFADAVARLAKESTRFDGLALSPVERRQLDLLKLSLVMATPSDPREAEELSALVSRMRAIYGKGRWCRGEEA